MKLRAKAVRTRYNNGKTLYKYKIQKKGLLFWLNFPIYGGHKFRDEFSMDRASAINFNEDKQFLIQEYLRAYSHINDSKQNGYVVFPAIDLNDEVVRYLVMKNSIFRTYCLWDPPVCGWSVGLSRVCDTYNEALDVAKGLGISKRTCYIYPDYVKCK